MDLELNESDVVYVVSLTACLVPFIRVNANFEGAAPKKLERTQCLHNRTAEVTHNMQKARQKPGYWVVDR